MRHLNRTFLAAALLGMAYRAEATEGQTGTAAAATAKKTKATPEITTVDMLDAEGKPTGRLVEFSGKRKMLKSSGVDTKGVFVQIDFVNGQARRFTIPEALFEKFAAHGAEQKLGDEIAGVDDIDDCVMAVDDLIDRLYSGEWGAKREPNAMAGASILAKALVEQSGQTLAVVRSYLSTKSHAEKVALRNNKAIKPIIDRLEAAKKSKAPKGPEIDTDSLLTALAAGNTGEAAGTDTAETAA